MSILLYGFSMEKIWKMKHPTFLLRSTSFIEKTINAQLSDQLNNPEVFELVNTCQVHANSRTFFKVFFKLKQGNKFSPTSYFLLVSLRHV